MTRKVHNRIIGGLMVFLAALTLFFACVCLPANVQVKMDTTTTMPVELEARVDAKIEASAAAIRADFKTSIDAKSEEVAKQAQRGLINVAFGNGGGVVLCFLGYMVANRLPSLRRIKDKLKGKG